MVDMNNKKSNIPPYGGMHMPKQLFPSTKRLLIAEHRQRRELTQESLAQLVGLSQTMLSLYESGQRDIPVSTLYAIALQLHIPIRELFPEEIVDPPNILIRN